ncbi:MAG: hypothetical protein L0H63_03245 [Nitrococcus sp.]|nr:hypothetical protein [Nitrococcus sp.]
MRGPCAAISTTTRKDGLVGLIDKCLAQASHRRAPVDEVTRLDALYRERCESCNVKHLYSFYCRCHRCKRSYTWVKNHLQIVP